MARGPDALGRLSTIGMGVAFVGPFVGAALSSFWRGSRKEAMQLLAAGVAMGLFYIGWIALGSGLASLLDHVVR
jgi:hypothetical protein